ncbi:MAG: hypothetical protein NPIRA02_25200 [Nitrospirales bacterium]|nr:MAG: hypothetical protein NPIRA02_25200 [Nitrospirales bacterium]
MPLIVIDTHVHMYDCFELATFLASAYKNCQVHAAHRQHHGPVLGVLLLTESSWDHWFQQFVTFADQNTDISHPGSSTWHFRRTNEDFTLFAESTQGEKLLIIAGRQLVTKEKFEVLALMTNQTFQDGMTIQESIEQVKNSGGMPVIPWAFGKWWGTRGKILTELMTSAVMSQVLLGDNSGRPKFLPYPEHFTLAHTQGIRILPGSDPLPLPSEYWRPCSVGLSFKTALDDATPGIHLQRLILDTGTATTAYFQHERLSRFIKNQIALNMRKHRPATAYSETK